MLCNKCQKSRSKSDFYPERRICKFCDCARVIEFKRFNPEFVMLSNAKRRAKKKGLAFNLTIDDVCIPNSCPLLDIPIILNGGDNSPSLDRIDSKKGYIKGNVWVISQRANTIKNNASIEELEKLAANLRFKLNRIRHY